MQRSEHHAKGLCFCSFKNRKPFTSQVVVKMRLDAETAFPPLDMDEALFVGKRNRILIKTGDVILC